MANGIMSSNPQGSLRVQEFRGRARHQMLGYKLMLGTYFSSGRASDDLGILHLKS